MKDCFAYYDEANSRVHIGNSRIEKLIRIKGSFICTEKVSDLTNGRTWSGGKPLWQRCPVLCVDETPAVKFEVSDVEAPLGMKPHVKAVIELSGREGSAWYEFTVFPDIPFVFNQIFAEKKGDIKLGEGAPEVLGCTGVEAQDRKSSDGDIICSADTLDCIPLGYSHLEVESVKLYDKTDRNDSLVERQTVPVYKNGRCERSGNIFRISDYPNGDSLMLVKHSPTQSSALNRPAYDLVFQGVTYAALLGTGIDFSEMPSGKVPYYASAIGVSKTKDIYEELWRYSTAISSGDIRGANFVMSNTWGDRSQDMAVCEEFMLKEIERARQLGVDIIQIDDGWQSGITANSLRKKGGVWEGYYKDNSDFWQVNPERFPNGLSPLIEKAKEYGIELGLWFSPDSSDDFVNVDKDIDTLMRLYKTHGVRYFKLDGVKIRSKLGEMRFIHMLDELTKRTGGEMRFNLDVTAEDRFGYLYQTQFGTLFVENRYTDFVNYFPHNTFKNLWNLASVVPARRLQMELLNIRRNTEKYKGLPFAPSEYKMDYVFAIVLPANPLVWMEMTHLADSDAELLSKITEVYKPYKSEIFNSRVIPIGDAPNGMSFPGYFCRNADKKSGHLLLFRESTADDTYTFKLPHDISGEETEILYQSAPTEVSVEASSVTVKFEDKRAFVWLKVGENK